MEEVIYIILAVVVLIVLIKSNKSTGKVIPGPSGWPLLGNALEITEQNLAQKSCDYAEQFGPIVRLKLFSTNVVLLNSIEMVQKAFNGDDYKQYFNDRPALFFSEHFTFGGQSLGSFKEGFGSVHSDLRKVFVKGLHVYGDGTKAFEANVAAELGNVVKRIEKNGGKEFEFIDQIKMSLSNLVSIALTGETLNENDEDFNLIWEFDKSLTFMLTPKADTIYSTFPFVRYIPGIYKDQYERASRMTRRLIQRYYTKVKETRTPGVIRGLIDYMLSERNKELKDGLENVILTEERIMGILQDMILAALVTTLSTLSSTILCLMTHPDCQEKVQKEIDEVIGRDRSPTIDDRANCTYLEAVLMEVQRLITVAAHGGLHICRHNLEFEGFDIPANTRVLPNLNFIHHDEKIWGPDAWNFRPERFLNDNGDMLPRSHVYRRNWVPFGIGRRQCPGDNFARTRLFLYTATFLQRWTFIPSPGKYGSCDTRSGDFEVDMVTRPKKFYCRVEKRV